MLNGPAAMHSFHDVTVMLLSGLIIRLEKGSTDLGGQEVITITLLIFLC